MGKADLTRDYYGDLELQPSADAAEIKKQFKKLALKWHPDRNPGREAEVNAKFQTIQSAHEILTDEGERRRYDAGRNRTSRLVSSSMNGGTRGNPYANAGAQWAPPPQPFGTPRANAAGQGTSGASRYQKFQEGSFRNSANKTSDQEAKKNHYDAWAKMKKQPPTRYPEGSFARAATGQWQPSGSPRAPDTRYTPQSGREESNAQKHPPPPRPKAPGYEEWNAQHMHGRNSARKSGFMPGNPEGDEPPAPMASSAYSNNTRLHRASTAKTSAAPEPPPRPKGFEKLLNPDEPVDGIGRQSTPYATHGGEKTNPFDSSNMHRSKTTRERSGANGYSTAREERGTESNSANSRDKHRSASPPRTRGFQNQPPNGGTAESPPKRTHSNINISPQPSAEESKKGGSRNSRFKSAANSDTSSGGEDSDIQARPPSRTPRKTLPRRKASAPAPAPTEAEASGTFRSSNNQQRKANLADFREMFHSGNPVLSDLCSEQPEKQKGSAVPTQEPMYEQDSHPSMFSNYPCFPSSFQRVQSQSRQSAAKDQYSQEVQFETPTKTGRKQSRSQLNNRSSTSTVVRNENASVRDSWNTYASSIVSDSPTLVSPADDLSNFEQGIAGELQRSFVNTVTPVAPRSKVAGQDTFRGKRFNIFGRSQGSSQQDSPIQASAAKPVDQNAGNVGKSPKRKAGDYDTNVNSPNSSPRKFPGIPGIVYDGLKDLLSNKTNRNINRFPTAYRTQASAQPSAVPPLFTASAAESINTRFDTKNWDGQFRASFNPPEFSNAPSRAGSRNGRKSPIKSKPRTRSASASIHSDASGAFEQRNPPVESPSKPFAPEEWTGPEMFATSTFAPPIAQGPVKAPFTQRTPSRKGSRVKGPQFSKTAGGKAAVVNEYSSESDKELFEEPSSMANGVGAAQPRNLSPNAMDIDSPYEHNAGTASQAGQPRNVPMEPLRPEWRDGVVNGNGQRPNFAGTPKQNATNGDDSTLNFNDLKNVEPLFQPAQGLDSVNDLKSSLPFASAAANTVPSKLPAPLQITIKIPNPPCPPKVPSRPTDGTQRMSPGSWHSYLVSFQAYITDYQLWNQNIELYFQARQAQSQELLRDSGWGWLETRGDDIFEKELLRAKEDRLVKEKWTEAARSHQGALEELRSVRAAMMGRTE